MNAFGLDLGVENGGQAMLPEKMMCKHSKHPKLLPLTMKPAQQELSCDIVLFFAPANHTHQSLPHLLIGPHHSF